jgi:hypothetical protein
MPRLGWAWLVAATCAACTVSNPGYHEDRRDGPPPVPDAGVLDLAAGDAPAPTDGEPARDLPPAKDRELPPDKRLHDVAPWPDSVPWQCSSSADCDDGLSCTTDSCGAQKKCESKLKSGWCLILGKCQLGGATNPQASCERCDPAASSTSWTVLADGAPCADEGVWCTSDVCKAGACEHPLSSSSCRINGVCYKSGDVSSASSCQVCNPAQSQTGWSPQKDGASCAGDSLWCTVDQCKAGVCTHELGAKSCLVGGACYGEGTSGPDACGECLPAKSTSSFTFVAGKGCKPPVPALAGICLKNKCAALVESLFEPPGPVSTALSSVDYIPSAGQVWAAGEFKTALGSGGALVQLGGGAVTPPVLTASPLKALSYRLAVGEAGKAWYHDGTKWVPHAKIEAALAGVDRNAAWGAALAGGVETFFLAGFNGSGGVGGVLQCTLDPGGGACTAGTGFQSSTLLGAIAGSVGPTGGQGPLWALAFGQSEDIYHSSGQAGASWSRSSPEGCQDYGSSSSTPCSNTSGDWRDVHASGPADAWAVGSSGILLQWDGFKWTRLSSAIAMQAGYNFTAVYSSPADKLVTVAATSWAGSGRWVDLFNFNRELNRWLGPIGLVAPANNNNQDELRDIGGQGYGNLWAVGQRLVPSMMGQARLQGWVVQLKP